MKNKNKIRIMNLFAIYGVAVDAKNFNQRFFLDQFDFGAWETWTITVALAVVIFALWSQLIDSIVSYIRNKDRAWPCFMLGAFAILFLGFSAVVSNSVRSKDRSVELQSKFDAVRIDSTGYSLKLYQLEMVKNRNKQLEREGSRYRLYKQFQIADSALTAEAYRITQLRAGEIEQISRMQNHGNDTYGNFLTKYTGVFISIVAPASMACGLWLRIKNGELEKSKNPIDHIKEYIEQEKVGDTPEKTQRQLVELTGFSLRKVNNECKRLRSNGSLG